MKYIFYIITISFVLTFNVFAQSQDVINSAIEQGDCETLYNFVQNPEGKDQRLITSVNQSLRRYTAIDPSTARHRTNRMDSRVRNLGRELMENVFTDPERYLPDVVTRLTTGVTDQFVKVKVLHDWICDNIAYDVETAFSRANRRQDYVSVLRVKKAVCAGYTNLYNRMCQLANIESVGISGFSKGFGYAGSIGPRPDHDWNAVKIGNKWYLIDVTWNAGHVDQRTFIKNYSTDYLFLDSRRFLYSHLPVENKYQFYAPIITKEQFMDEPYIAGVFFKYGVELKNNLPRYNNLINEGFTIELTNSNSNVMLSSNLRTLNQNNVENSSWQSRSGNNISFTFDVPDTQDYKGSIFARLRNDKKIIEKISIGEFEQRIVPELDNLLQTRKITEREKEFFINSYFKVQENSSYYFLEDQFDTQRNNAVIKIHPLVDLSLEMLEPILVFSIKAQSGYDGYRNIYTRRFPNTFSAYNQAPNTSLLSPINGELTAGSTEAFTIDSRDYQKIAIIIDGQFTFFEKNNTLFELSFEIPAGITELKIYGTKNNRNYEGLLIFKIN
jgi:hypothetical protein